MEKCFLASAEGNVSGGGAWKRGSLYPWWAMLSVEWRNNVYPCISGRQLDRWSGMEKWFLTSAESNALGGVAWIRVSLYPRRAMRSVEWRGNAVALCAEGNSLGVVAWMWFLVCAQGNALGGVTWKRGSLYPWWAMRSVEWRGNIAA